MELDCHLSVRRDIYNWKSVPVEEGAAGLEILKFVRFDSVLNSMHCTVLYCTALYCTVIYCTALYCTALHCTVLYCTVL